MKFRADEIASVLREEIANYKQKLHVEKIGKVLEVGDGIARVFGLSEAMAGEMLEFQTGAIGQVFNLEENSVGVVIYTDSQNVKAGHSVKSTGRLMDIPAGLEMLGRVIDPAGNVLDGGDEIATQTRRPMEFMAPGIAGRQPVDQPLQTGIKAIDSMTPIGKGQRELIIGDRKTGKTAIAIDTIINQKSTGVICVYVAIGQKESTVAGFVEKLKSAGALGHTVVVSASSSDPAPLQYIAPYAGCAIAEHFMELGKHTLVIYDDLTKQAAAYRQISLLLRRPPGREAYPGDVFYLHSRLLERACKLAESYTISEDEKGFETIAKAQAAGAEIFTGPIEKKRAEKSLGKNQSLVQIAQTGGSMTALPICETQEGEVSAYIPTNLISITDGQIYLEPSLFFAGVRPAINVGISVSRVGYKAATQAMKKVAASLRLDLAAFRELESFAQLGMELDPASQKQLDRGQRMVKLLTQPQYQPASVPDQVLAIAMGNSGALDDIELKNVEIFEQNFLKYFKTEHADIYKEICDQLDLPDAKQKRIKFIAGEYKQTQWLDDLKKATHHTSLATEKITQLPAL